MWIGDLSGDTQPVEDPDYFTFKGEQFEVLPTVGAMALTRFAANTKTADAQIRRGQQMQKRAQSPELRAEGVAIENAGELSGLAAVHDLMLSALGEAELARFGEHADRVGCDFEDLMRVANAVYTAISERPTRRPSNSSPGPSTTGTPSTPSPSSEGSAALAVVPTEPEAQEQVVPESPVERRRRELAEIRGVYMAPVEELLVEGGSSR